MDDRLLEAGARIEATIHKINGHWWNRRKRPDARDLRILLEAVTDQSARLGGVKEGLEMAGEAELNVNETVRVRLTDAGREYHRRWHESQYPMLDYRAPEESDDGWSKWQLWVLMREIGAGMYMGGPSLFETTIRLDRTAIRAIPVKADDRERA